MPLLVVHCKLMKRLFVPSPSRWCTSVALAGFLRKARPNARWTFLLRWPPPSVLKSISTYSGWPGPPFCTLEPYSSRILLKQYFKNYQNCTNDDHNDPKMCNENRTWPDCNSNNYNLLVRKKRELSLYARLSNDVLLEIQHNIIIP